tara:strand:- start:2726 stop:3520 length:795 start_codon:yes stop_codon:yes gene_type:complete
MKKTNKIYEIFDKDSQYLNSDWNVKFREQILRLLKKANVVDSNFEDLENIHKNLLDKSLLDYCMASGVNGITKHLYDVDNEFVKVYHSFMKDLYKKLGFDFYFQTLPTIRVHCPNTKNENHYPRYHNDIFYGHPPEEINIWFSLTENKNSEFYFIDVETSMDWFKKHNCDGAKFLDESVKNINHNKLGNKLSKQVNGNLHSVFLFDSFCIHSNKPRNEDTRVSIDCRINPVEDFKDGYVGMGRMKSEFKPGGRAGYYKKSIGEM